MRVIIVGDDPQVRRALGLLLTQALDMHVVGDACDLLHLWAQLEETTPDILIVEWAVLGPMAREVLARLRATHPGLQIVILSCKSEAYEQALASGADGYICTGDSPDRVVTVLRAMQVPR